MQPQTFTFLYYPVGKNHHSFYKSRFSFRPLISRFLSLKKNKQSFAIYKIKRIQSSDTKAISGFLIYPSRVNLSVNDDYGMDVIDKIFSAVELARRLGTDILGLGGSAALVCDRGYTALKNISIPVTSGSALSAWTVFEGIYRFARVKGINLKETSLAIVGADTAVGSLCARKLCEYVQRMSLISHNERQLEPIRETIMHLNPLEIKLQTDVHEAVKDKDIIIVTDIIPKLSFSLEDPKAGAIVFDATFDGNVFINKDSRPDITVIRAGLMKLPSKNMLGIRTGLGEGLVWSSFAETMLLSLENKISAYSFGSNVNLDKMDEIADIAVRHGFEVWVPEAPVL